MIPAAWSVFPFILLLLMIATGPLFYPRFWHKNYPVISIALGAVTVIYYLFILHDEHHPVHVLFEYISFISLLTALFSASGGILISVDKEGTPAVNCLLLLT
ncbi:MAG TPA: sodium:proton antiporter, partial [Chitinophagales bacterium]|nr:sodium:proton antiporter [Chitinophagales bacterium]